MALFLWTLQFQFGSVTTCRLESWTDNEAHSISSNSKQSVVMGVCSEAAWRCAWANKDDVTAKRSFDSTAKSIVIWRCVNTNITSDSATSRSTEPVDKTSSTSPAVSALGYYAIMYYASVCLSVPCPPLTRKRKSIKRSDLKEMLPASRVTGRAILRSKGYNVTGGLVWKCEMWNV